MNFDGSIEALRVKVKRTTARLFPSMNFDGSIEAAGKARRAKSPRRNFPSMNFDGSIEA